MRRQRRHIAIKCEHDDLLARHFDQLARGLVGDHLAAVDDGDALAQLLGFLEVMRGQNHRHARGVHFLDQLPQLAAQFDVDAGCRLIEHQHWRLMHQRLGDQQPPPHAARERARISARLVLQMHRAQQIHRAAQGLGHAPQAGSVFQHFIGRKKGIEDDFLRHNADRALGVAHLAIDIEAPDAGRPRSLAHHAGEYVDQGRLARTIGAEQAENAALRHVKAHPVERQLSGTLAGGGIAFDEILDRDRGRQGHGCACGAGMRRGKVPRAYQAVSSASSLTSWLRDQRSFGFSSTARA